jgi:enamine deaminase RidA (YjgF/YER057c/UK114 family)
MTSREVIVSPSWQSFYEGTGIPAAVWADGKLHVSGHTGEDEEGHFPALEGQIRGTFTNLTETLTQAGVAWSDVVSLTSYHVGLSGQKEASLRIAGDFLQPPFPAWTAVGVTELWDADALIEISCVATAPVSKPRRADQAAGR